MAALAVSAGSARLLLHRAGIHPASQTAFDYFLALAAFVFASGGSAMTFVGAHLFDEVELSQRWRPLRPARSAKSAIVKEHRPSAKDV